jgi:hypothetical protein
MPRKTSAGSRHAGRPLKSPLAMTSSHFTPGTRTGTADDPSVRETALTGRKASIAEYEDYLRTTTNRDDRPYEEGSINA